MKNITKMIDKTIRDCETLTKNISESFGFITGALRESIRIPVRISYLIFKKLDVIEDNVLPLNKKELFNTIVLYLQEAVHAKKAEPNMTNVNEALREVNEYIPIDNKQDKISITNHEKILHAYNKLQVEDKKVIFDSVKEMAKIMLSFQKKVFLKEQNFIKDFDDLANYSYGVAGVVGDSLTNIFMNHDEKNKEEYLSLLEPNGDKYNNSEKTGIFLQYVNIIKDKIKDEKNNQYFWPSSSTESYEQVALEEMIKHTNSYFNASKEYIARLPKTNKGARVFVSAAFLKAFYELNKIIKYNDIEKGTLTSFEKLKTLFKAFNYGSRNNGVRNLALLN